MTYLEYMERLKLYIFALVSEEIHHHLQVGLVSNITRHNIEVRAIEEDFA